MENAGYLGIGSLITAVITGIVWGFIKLAESNEERKRKRKQDRMDEQDKIIARLDKELADLKKEYDDLVKQKIDYETRYIRAIARIEILEEALTNAKIPFRKWKDGNTDSHAPLSKDEAGK